MNDRLKSDAEDERLLWMAAMLIRLHAAPSWPVKLHAQHADAVVMAYLERFEKSEDGCEDE